MWDLYCLMSVLIDMQGWGLQRHKHQTVCVPALSCVQLHRKMCMSLSAEAAALSANDFEAPANLLKFC